MIRFHSLAVSSYRLAMLLLYHFVRFCAISIFQTTPTEGYVDSGVKILIAVVIGALLLAGLYALYNTTIMPTVTTKITDLFNFKG